MTSKDNQKKQAYISPAMEVANIEMQQSILAGSCETLGTRHADLGWDDEPSTSANSSRGNWGNLWD